MRSPCPGIHRVESPLPDDYRFLVFKDNDFCTRLARTAIAAWVRERKQITVPADVPAELADRRAGAFVSLKKGDRLRGCIGTVFPTQPSLAEEIICNAIRAASRDPRFPPLTPEELPEITVSVDVLATPETCSPQELDPKKYGVVVQAGERLGLLLPDLPGVTSADEQLAIARQKAGIPAATPCTLQRFTVERHQEQ